MTSIGTSPARMEDGQFVLHRHLVAVRSASITGNSTISLLLWKHVLQVLSLGWSSWRSGTCGWEVFS